MEAPPSAVPPRPAPPRRPFDRVRSWATWFGVSRLVASGAAIVLVAVGAWWLLHAPRPSTESQLPYASVASTAGSGSTSSATAAPPTTSTPDAIVHVAGAVASPGVYHLPATSRVVDAIAAAGGLTAAADTDGVNLAAPVRDGSRIYVPESGEAVPVVVAGAEPSPGTTLPAGPIDLNAATVEQLDTLPGVGPSTAAAIVAYRDQHGPFAAVDDLGEVRGIGPAKLDALRGLVTT